MDIRNTTLLNSLLAIDSQKQRIDGSQRIVPTKQNDKTQSGTSDRVSLSGNQEDQKNQFTRNPNQTFLVKERLEEVENGFRRLQEFESLSGRKFTRIEEVVNQANRSTRTIVQQNNSGSTTLLENVFDRQENGTFRLTQRYTDENGDTSSNIQYNLLPTDKELILGKAPRPTSSDNPFQVLRGTELDLSA